MDNTTLQILQTESYCRDLFKHLDEHKEKSLRLKELKEKHALQFMLDNYYIIDNYKETYNSRGEIIAYNHVPKGKYGVSYSDWCTIYNTVLEM